MYRILLLVSLLVAYSLGVPRKRSLTGKVVGGENATIEKYPYMVSVELDLTGSNFCGGSIISKDYVLSAAYGIRSVPLTRITVRSGSSTLLTGGTEHGVSDLIVHPEFNGGYEYDIAILKVSIPFEFGLSVLPIPLATEEPDAGDLGTVAGWGLTSYKGTRSIQLQVVFLPVIDRDVCDWNYQDKSAVITSNMICAGFDEGGKDACLFDGGGPLVIEGKVAGVISWGFECARAAYPGVYTNVVPFRDFIFNVTSVE